MNMGFCGDLKVSESPRAEVTSTHDPADEPFWCQNWGPLQEQYMLPQRPSVHSHAQTPLTDLLALFGSLEHKFRWILIYLNNFRNQH